jgi:uncharacterized protein (TIGR03437 family)
MINSCKLCSILAVCLGISTGAHAQVNRINGPIERGRPITLAGHMNPKAQAKFDRGPVAPDFKLSILMALKPSESQIAALDRLLEAQQDPASPEYRKWLTPEQYADRFGLTANDIGRVIEWLRLQGFTMESAARGRDWIAFSGTSAQVEAAFHAGVHRYEVDGENHFAVVSDPMVPAALEALVGFLVGLDDFQPKPSNSLRPAATLPTGLINLTPADLQTIYDIHRLHDTGIDGTGQKIVVVGQTAVDLSDVQAFRKMFKLSDANIQVVQTGPDPGKRPGFLPEADLDLEYSGAMAPNSTLVYVYSSNLDMAIFHAIDQNLAPVLSDSFGACEALVPSALPATYETEAKKANSMGITWVVATGDTGAANCDRGTMATQGLAVSFPSNLPEVTAVGGTEFNEGVGAANFWADSNDAAGGSAQSYIPEIAWNDTPYTAFMSSGGGGNSKVFPKPSWQKGPGVPNNNARNLPDVALDAGNGHDPYAIISGGQVFLGGGTSASAPVFAGIVALLDQYLAQNPKAAAVNQSNPVSFQGAGNINPILYGLAQSMPAVFHDILTGSNVVPCEAESPDCVNGQLGYNAGPGYDLATGLGSVDAYNMVTSWNGIAAGTASITSLAPASATAGDATFTLTVNGSNFGPGAQVQWNGAGIPTTAVSSTELQASVDASLVAAPGIAPVTVSLTGKSSGVAYFVVSAASSHSLPYNPVVTKVAPQACTPPPAMSAFVTTDATIYVSFQATMTDNDRLIISWLAPDSNTYQTVYPKLKPGDYCGLSVNFSIANLPVSQLGAWSVRVFDNSTQIFSIPFTITLPGAAAPTVGAVVNGASFKAGAPVAPGSLATVFGTGYAKQIYASSIPLPALLSGVSVIVNGRPTPLVFLNDTQVNFEIPLETPPGAAKVVVQTNGVPSASFTFQVQAVAPGLFVALNNADGSPNGTAHPAAAGDFLIVYMTGQGPVDHPLVDGVPTPNPPPLFNATKPFSATIGGANAAVPFLGLSPAYVGLAQANVQVPKLAPGTYPLVITVDGVASNSLSISVK